MEEPTQKRVPSRRKQRREYLRRRRNAYLGTAANMALLGLLLAILVGSAWFSYSALDFYWHVDEYSDLPYWSALLAFVGLVSLPFVWLFWGRVRYQVKEVTRLSRVASVYAGVIPAEEILVRASSQPADASATLLRAALIETDMPEQELLRAGEPLIRSLV